MPRPATQTAPPTDAALREEAAALLRDLYGEALAEAVARLRAAAAPPETNAAGEPLVSFDPDGTGYTAAELGDMLDARMERMRRGEGVLTLEEFKARREARWR